MYLHRDQAYELLQAHKQGLLTSLRGSHSFLNQLLDGDDWSFVIKAQVLIEGSVTQAVLAQIGDERLKKTIDLMPLTGDKVSKLGLTRDLGLLTKNQRRFVKRMASLRNLLAHRVENVDFTFEGYVASLDTSVRRDWQESIVWFTDTSQSREVWFRLAIEHARAVIYLGTFLLVATLAVNGSEKEALREIGIAAETTTRELLDSLPLPGET